MQSLGCAGEVEFFGNGNEASRMTKFHGYPLYLISVPPIQWLAFKQSLR